MDGFNEYNEWIYHITGCFYYFSSTVNPILYNVMSAKYRNAFKWVTEATQLFSYPLAQDSNSCVWWIDLYRNKAATRGGW